MVIFLSSVDVLVSFGLVTMYILLHLCMMNCAAKEEDELCSLVHSVNAHHVLRSMDLL